MDKKNVALFINTLGFGGAESVVSRLSEIMKDQYNIFVLLVDARYWTYDCNVEIIDLGGTYSNYHIRALRSCFSIRKIIKERNIECIISFLDIPNMINILFTGKSVRSIISIRGYGQISKVSLFRKRVYQQLYKRADYIVTVSEVMKFRFVENYNISDAKVMAIANPYNTDKIQELSDEKIEKEVLEFMQQYECASAMGRLVESKGYIYLFESLKMLLRENRKAGLIVIGSGELEEFLREKAKKLGIDKNIYFLGFKKNPYKYIKQSKLYISTSLREGFPNALVESMACGIPVIHTDCLTGPKEILCENYKNYHKVKKCELVDYGILIPDFSPIIHDVKLVKQYEQSLAEIWGRLLSDPEVSSIYGKKAKQRASEYNEKICIRRYMEVIERNRYNIM